MGDRTCVEITAREIDLEWILHAEFEYAGSMEKRLNSFLDDISVDLFDRDKETGTVSFCQYECNYAEWDELEETLLAHNAPYNKHWDAGGNYTAGDSYTRLVDGKVETLHIYDENSGLADFLKGLQGKSGAEIVAAVQVKYTELYPFEVVDLEDL